MKHEKKTAGLLSDFNILDLTDYKGSFCSKLLADMGSRVIKIEKPLCRRPRPCRSFPENRPWTENLSSFLYHNNNKLGITLDIEKPEGRIIFLSLVKKYDIIIETFPVGYLKKNGLDYNKLKKENPKLIMASISGFGQNGPRKDHIPCDIVLSAYGGHMAVSGSSSAGPLRLFGDQSYYSSSLFAAVAVIIAVSRRRITGKGAHLDISLQESVTATLDHVMPTYFTDGTVAGRQGPHSWNGMFSVLPCKDGFIQITLFYQWETLIEWLDDEGMAEDLNDKRWLDEDYRRENIGHVIKILSRWTKKHPVNELFKLGQLMNFPWAPVQSIPDLIDCPQLKSRNFFLPVHHSGFKITTQHPGIPFKINGVRTAISKGAPTIGQDNIKIYHDELGISKKELDRLANDNII